MSKKITDLPPTALGTKTDLFEKVDGPSGVSQSETTDQLAAALGIKINGVFVPPNISVNLDGSVSMAQGLTNFFANGAIGAGGGNVSISSVGAYIADSLTNVPAIQISNWLINGINAQSILDLAGTWNTTGTPTAIKLVITDTASNAASLFLDFQTAAAGTKFNISKTGKVALTPSDNVSALTIAGNTLSASNVSLLDLSQTWNGAVTPTVIKLVVTDTAHAGTPLLMDLRVGVTSEWNVDLAGNSTQNGWLRVADGSATTPSHSFGSATNSGLFNSAGNPVMSKGGTAVCYWNSPQMAIRSDGSYAFSSTADATGAVDLTLFRDAANVLAQRNGTNAQALRIYRTFTDSSNYERMFVQANAGTEFEVGTEAVGTGAGRALRLKSANVLVFAANGTDFWRITTTGTLFASTDGVPDIGVKGANRPKNGYFSSFLTYLQQILTKTADYTVLATESGAVYTNSGAAGQVIFTLPTWAVGLFYIFDVETAQNLRVLAPGTDTIRIAGSVSAGGGRIDNATIGGMIMIAATLSGKWVAICQEGTWTVT